MKKILISIKPEYVAKILNREKIIEIRKTMPKCELPCKVYIYCTKDTKRVLAGTPIIKNSWKCWNRCEWNKQKKKDCGYGKYNGKIIAEFTLNEVETIEKNQVYNASVVRHNACLNIMQLHDYIKGKRFHAWHIDDLKIYDEPRELSEFVCRKPLKRPPQSWCYVE